jgi:hypothetical protein
VKRLLEFFDSNIVFRILVLIISVLIVWMLMVGAFFSLAFAGCYGQGGFCVGRFNIENIYSATAMIAASGPFIVFPFNKSKQVLLKSLLISTTLGVVIGVITYLRVAP